MPQLPHTDVWQTRSRHEPRGNDTQTDACRYITPANGLRRHASQGAQTGQANIRGAMHCSDISYRAGHDAYTEALKAIPRVEGTLPGAASKQLPPNETSVTAMLANLLPLEPIPAAPIRRGRGYPTSSDENRDKHPELGELFPSSGLFPRRMMQTAGARRREDGHEKSLTSTHGFSASQRM